jgi:hypothetical protein
MDYYAGKSNKALDNESPNPQFFPVVKEDTVFSFTVVPLRKSRDCNFSSLDFAIKYLKFGIEEQGVGAKTSAGYGWFQEDPEIKKAEEAKIEEEKRIREEKLRVAAELKKKEENDKLLLKEIEERREREAIEVEAHRIAQEKAGFSTLKNSVDLGKILSLALKLQQAQNGSLTEEKKAELTELLKNSHAATGQKDNNWKKKSKSKETWKKIRVLLGDASTSVLKEELS